MKNLWMIILLFLGAGALTGCSGDTADEAEDAVEEALDEAGDAAEEAGDEVEEALEGGQ